MTFKRKGRYILLLFMTVFLAGCSNQKPAAENVFDSDYVQMTFSGPARFKEGEFLVVDGLSYYVDHEKAMAVPICNKPDCRHLPPRLDNDSTCNAAQNDQVIFPYAGQLYGISHEGSEELELYTSDLDGNNRTKLGSFPGGSGLQDFIRVRSNLYYTTFSLEKEVIQDNGSDLKLVWKMYRLDLDTKKAKEILSYTGGGNGLLLLGGTKDYQIYSTGDEETQIYCLDYETGESEKLPIEGQAYGSILPRKTGRAFYYVHGTGHETGEIHCYDMDQKEDHVCVSEDEIGKALSGSKWTVDLQSSFDKGILFGAYTTDMSDSGVFLMESADAPLKELLLPEQLKKEESQFNGFCSETEEGMFFWYFREEEIGKDPSGNIMTDTARWYAYIGKNALLHGRNEVKDVIDPMVSAMANPIDQDGKILY